MKAISLWQPWASLWCSQRKRHETRGWSTKHRGWLAVHAAKISCCSALDKTFGADKDGAGESFRKLLIDEFGGHWAMDLPRGAIIGCVHISNCLPTSKVTESLVGKSLQDWSPEQIDDMECGNFSAGRFAFEKDRFALLKAPVPYKGRQMMFEVPDSIFEGLI